VQSAGNMANLPLFGRDTGASQHWLKPESIIIRQAALQMIPFRQRGIITLLELL